MKRLALMGLALILLLGFLAVSPPPSSAEVEVSVLSERTLSEEPLDMAMSGDGQTMLILTKGKILFYSLQENRVTESVSIDPALDTMTLLPVQDSTIVALSSRSTKAFKILNLEVTKVIDVSGHPFKGAEKAPVVIAVFSDYQ